jgi:hypothetical protein
MEVPDSPLHAAIRRVQTQVQWKPGKARQHLAKRLALGHLPPQATIAEYHARIHRIVQTPDAEVFVYRWRNTDYPTIVAEVEGVRWLVMLSLEGLMETAFPPALPEQYLADPRFTRLGTLEELGL